MRYRVIFQPRDELELQEAYRWISEESPGRAARWLNGIQEAIDSLETHPERCPLDWAHITDFYLLRRRFC
jgi:plasmid stabilization system protein ParE